MKVIASILIILGLVIGIVPHYTDCQSQGRSIALPDGRTIPMKCHWTGEAEIALATPLVFMGGLSAYLRRRETRLALGAIGAVLGVFVVLLPTALIGVCTNPEMMCNMVMKPTLILSGTVAALLSGATFALAWREKDEPVEQHILVGEHL